MHTDHESLLGQLFVIDELEDLELLTDLLEIRGEHLNLALAVESYIQSVPQGYRRLSPIVSERLQRSVKVLRNRFDFGAQLSNDLTSGSFRSRSSDASN